MKHAHLETEY